MTNSYVKKTTHGHWRLPTGSSAGLAVAAVLLAVCLPSQAPEVADLDDAGLQQMVVALQPVVEKVCGRKFQKPPIAVLADSGDMMRVFRVELEPQVAAFFRGQPARRIRRALQLRADVVGGSAIGKYAFASGEVLIVPQRIALNLQVLGLREVDEHAVLQLFVAHELVHALQQQEMRFGKRYAEMVAMDRIDSLSMRTEGHAVMCAEMVMRELGHAAAIDASRAIVAGSAKPLQGLGSLLDMRRARCRGALLYLTGADVMYETHRRSGMEEVWKLVRSEGPIAELLRPQQPPAEVQNLQHCFDGVDEQLGGSTWCVGSGALSEIQLLSENYVAREQLIALMAKCRGAAQWEGSSPTPAIWRSATALRFDTAATATAFRELAERCAETDLTLVSQEAAAPGAGPELRGAISRVLRQDSNGQKAAIYWFERGEHVVQFTLIKAPLDEELLVQVADKVLRALAT